MYFPNPMVISVFLRVILMLLFVFSLTLFNNSIEKILLILFFSLITRLRRSLEFIV